ncbi:MAG: hypothetical protein IJH77_02705, partial [Mogibacterium sp.]|nr:hypothetical protein [Mogibacterium sp.]
YGTDVDTFAWGRTILYLKIGLPRNGTAPKTVSLQRDEKNKRTSLCYSYAPKPVYSTYVTDSDARVLEVAIKALSENPADRYPDGAALVKALDA